MKNAKNVSKKILGLGILGATSLVMVACGGGNSGSGNNAAAFDGIEGRYELDPNTPAWQLDTREERQTITWFVQAEWWNTTWNEDFVTERIARDLNIDVEFRVGGEDVLSTIFASGELPDIISLFDSNSTAARGASSWALPLNDLAERYDPYFFNVASRDTLNWFQLESGNTYGFANYSNSFADFYNDTIPASSAFLVRRDVYEAIGEMPMSTPEEFRAAMTVIREMFPELEPFGTGAETGTFNFAFMNFIGVPIVTEDGQWYDRQLDPAYLDWLRTFSDLHTDGYINDDRFAWDHTVFEELVRQGNFATMLVDGMIGLSSSLQVWMSENPGSEYIAIDGPQVPGRSHTLNQSGISGWMINYITNQATDPATAIQLFTYLLSDHGQMLVFFGEEGETFEKLPNGNVRLLPEIQAMRENDTQAFQREMRLGEFIPFGHDRFNMMNDQAFLEAIQQPIEWGRGKLVPQFVIENINPNPGTPEAMSHQHITQEWDRTLISLIRANDHAEFDSIIEDFVAFRNNNNFPAIVDVFNENIQRNMEILGLN